MKILMVNKFFYIKGGSETYYFALKRKLEKEGHIVIDFSMKDLFEIIFLCAEAVILSIIGEIYAIQGIGVFLFVFFEETAIFFFNYIVKYIASVFFGEAEENYY